MKTQLIQDFNESGSVPAGPAPAAPAPNAPPQAAPAAPPAVPPAVPPEVPPSSAVESSEPITEPATQPRPAVWHRPQQAGAQAQGAHPPFQAHGFAPQPPGLFGSGAQETTVPDTAAPMNARRQMRPRDTTDVNSDADWLTELLARDAEEQSESQRSGRWLRRLATWGTASIVLVLLAAGGLWLYQESRVEGALVVVANTSPAPAATASRSSLAGASAALPKGAGMAAVAAPPPSSRPAEAHNGAEPGVGAVGGTSGAATASAAGDAPRPVVAAAEPAVPAPKPRRAHVRKHPKAEARAEIPADSEPSARQRREETLMQCRARGYDDQQCLERGCEMTRFGFACKG
jgi:hypothetical protein